MTQRQIAAIKEEARLAEEKRREKIRFDNFIVFVLYRTISGITANIKSNERMKWHFC